MKRIILSNNNNLNLNLTSEVFCLVGNNAKENWLLLDNAPPTAIFFHLSSFPSCYVILYNSKYDPLFLYKAAKICLDNTKYRNIKGIYVDYTPISNVEKGDTPGEIVYRSSRKVKKVKV